METQDECQYAGDLGVVVRDLGRRIGARTGLLAVPEPLSGGLDPVAAWGTLPRWHAAAPPSGDSFVAQAARAGRVLAAPIARGDESLGIPLTDAAIRYAVGAPVHPHDHPPGVLCTGFSEPPDVRQDWLTWMVESYARIAALCVSERDAFGGLLAAARRDAVTGCLNQGAVRHEVFREIRRAERDGAALSCCFVDLDRFKAVNDRLGHLEGTKVLRRVALELHDGLRAGDTLGRYGGDKFIIVLPGCDETSASLLAERLRHRVQATHRASPGIDASFGVAQWRCGMDAEALLLAADAALLVAKRRGGALTVVADDGRCANNGTDLRQQGPVAARGIPRTGCG